jgi:DNA-binding winged helix-turn-helix (wHTH) protein
MAQVQNKSSRMVFPAMMKSQTKRLYVFGHFRIDAVERILFGERGVISLTPKAFDTLLILVENSGHVLSKEELMERVWPDSFVEENNLAQNISMLRKALGEESGGGGGGGSSSGGQKFIETVPKRGYRFVADVKEMLGRARGRMDAWPHKEMQAASDERQQEKGKSRDVVIIGRAIEFKNP